MEEMDRRAEELEKQPEGKKMFMAARTLRKKTGSGSIRVVVDGTEITSDENKAESVKEFFEGLFHIGAERVAKPGAGRMENPITAGEVEVLD